MSWSVDPNTNLSSPPEQDPDKRAKPPTDEEMRQFVRKYERENPRNAELSAAHWLEFAMDAMKTYGIKTALRLCEVNKRANESVCLHPEFWKIALEMYFGLSVKPDKNISQSRLVRERMAQVVSAVENKRRGSFQERGRRLRQFFQILAESYKHPLLEKYPPHLSDLNHFYGPYGFWIKLPERQEYVAKLYIEYAAREVDGVDLPPLNAPMLTLSGKIERVGTEEFFERTLYVLESEENGERWFCAYDLDRFKLGRSMKVSKKTAHFFLNALTPQHFPLAWMPAVMFTDIGMFRIVYESPFFTTSDKRVSSIPGSEQFYEQANDRYLRVYLVYRDLDQNDVVISLIITLLEDTDINLICRIIVPRGLESSHYGEKNKFIFYYQTSTEETDSYKRSLHDIDISMELPIVWQEWSGYIKQITKQDLASRMPETVTVNYIPVGHTRRSGRLSLFINHMFSTLLSLKYDVSPSKTLFIMPTSPGVLREFNFAYLPKTIIFGRVLRLERGITILPILTDAFQMRTGMFA